MNEQGLIGAIAQYWDIEPKARLGRRNSFFNDHQVSNTDALRFCIIFTVLVIAIGIFWCLLGVII